jgi:hypothetical protein
LGLDVMKMVYTMGQPLANVHFKMS